MKKNLKKIALVLVVCALVFGAIAGGRIFPMIDPPGAIVLFK
jgi:hypothetical protein